MYSKRFIHLRDLAGYDNQRIARMFNIDVAEVEDYCLGKKPVPEKVVNDLEEFADWSIVTSHTDVKKELASKYLSQPDQE